MYKQQMYHDHMKKPLRDIREEIFNLALCESRQTVQPLKAAHQSTLYPMMGLHGKKEQIMNPKEVTRSIVGSVDLSQTYFEKPNTTDFI